MQEVGLATNATALDINVKISDVKDQVDRAHTMEQQRAIRQWLSAPDPSTNYSRALSSRHGSTGSWLLNSKTFMSWKDHEPLEFLRPRSSCRLLWLHGKPGSGKTVLSSTVIEQIRKGSYNTKNVAVVYFYFDFTDSQKQDPDNMIRSLSSQLLEYNLRSFDMLKAAFVSCDNGNRQPNIEELVEVLKGIINSLQETFIILDALDECSERKRQGLHNIIAQILESDAERVHILLTSRKLADIEDALDPLTDHLKIIDMESTLIDPDISAYIDEVLQSDTGFRRWRNSPQVRDEIRTVLTQKADGM